MRQRTHGTRTANVRRQLTVGPAGDRYEREADRVAKQVVSRLGNEPAARPSDGPVHRLELDDEELLQGKRVRRAALDDEELLQGKRVRRAALEDEELVQGKRVRRALDDEELLQGKPAGAIGAEGGVLDAATAGEIDRARGGGQPLADGVRRSMEGAFGADFSAVRVHDGATSGRLNAQLGARAFTTGSDVFVRPGEYRPGSRAGDELLAHELTHVVQQTGSAALDGADT